MPQHEEYRLENQATPDRGHSGSEHPAVDLGPPESVVVDKSEGKLAKDTGCCLYSAITFLVIMLVTLGLVLMFVGPMLSKKIPPANQPVKSMDQPVVANVSIRHIRADPDNQNSTPSATNSTPELLGTPEALRGGYLAYVPFPEEEELEEYYDYRSRRWRTKVAQDRKPVIVPLMIIPGDDPTPPELVKSQNLRSNLPVKSNLRSVRPTRPPLKKIAATRPNQRLAKNPQLRPTPTNLKRPQSLLNPPPAQRFIRVQQPPRPLHNSGRRIPTSREADYRYPTSALSIQDIITYMTELGYDQQKIRHQVNFGKERVPSNDYERIRSEPKQSDLVRQNNSPYSFLLDVYPTRDGDSLRNPESEQYEPPVYVPDSLRQGPRLPSSEPSFRQQPNNPTAENFPAETNEAGINGYRIQYFDSDQLRNPPPRTATGRRPPLPLQSPSYSSSFSTESSPGGRDNKQPERKIVVHLNVFDQKPTPAPYQNRGNARFRRPGEFLNRDDYLTPSDIYRSSVRNYDRRNRYRQGEIGSGSRRSSAASSGDRSSSNRHFQQNSATNEYVDDWMNNPSLMSVSHQFEDEEGDLYRNHKMAATEEEEEEQHQYVRHYRRPVVAYPSASTFQSEEDEVESLPSPMSRK